MSSSRTLRSKVLGRSCRRCSLLAATFPTRSVTECFFHRTNFGESRRDEVALGGVLSLVATGTSEASSFAREGGHTDVLVQPNDRHLREGTSTRNRRASHTHARGAPSLRDVGERVRKAAP